MRVKTQESKSHDVISVVLPCLNEAETLAASIRKAMQGIQEAGCAGEVIVADNGSSDSSKKVAAVHGAKVIEVSTRGYGAALQAGFREAKGSILVMGDADDTYDFRQIPLLYAKYKDGFEFVSGNRLNAQMEKDAMPWLHQHIGVPLLTLFLNIFFPTNCWDGHCGLRLFSKDAYSKMALQSNGMEFASEMLIRASQEELKMTEVPIQYGARHTKSYSKLNTFRDGFRHLALILRAAIGLPM